MSRPRRGGLGVGLTGIAHPPAPVRAEFETFEILCGVLLLVRIRCRSCAAVIICRYSQTPTKPRNGPAARITNLAVV